MAADWVLLDEAVIAEKPSTDSVDNSVDTGRVTGKFPCDMGLDFRLSVF